MVSRFYRLYKPRKQNFGQILPPIPLIDFITYCGYCNEIIVQTRLLAILQDCRQSCEIVKICECQAVCVQLSDFWLWWRHYSHQPNMSRKIVPRLFIERLFLYYCEIVARLLKKIHVWYALIARLFRDCCKIVARLLKIFTCAMYILKATSQTVHIT